MSRAAARPNAAVLAAASDWFGRRDGGLSPAEEEEFQVWIAVPEHAQAYRRLERIWGRIPLSAEARRNTLLSFIVPVAVAGAAAVAIFLAVRKPAADVRAADARHESTALGEQRRVLLADGSVVLLNTASAVAVSYRPDARLITLERGEAHFQVAKNAHRPFTVSAAGATVRAVGTAFDVWIRPNSVAVTVDEGVVQVDGSTEVPAGSRAEIVVAAGKAGSLAVTPLDAHAVQQALAWREDRLEMGPTPLRVWVEQFNRYNRHRLLIADPQLGGVRIGGTFRPHDYAAFVRVLEANFGVRARESQDATWLERAQ